MRLVQCCINYRVISTRCPRRHCVVVNQRWTPIVSFFRLVLTRISGTDYFDINATLYQVPGKPVQGKAAREKGGCGVGIRRGRN